MSSNGRVATIQIDLDGAWVLLKMLGYHTEEDPDPLFERGVPRLLALLERYGVQATFFVNAIDLERPARRALIERILAGGHEVANHGMDHAYWSGLSTQEKRRQIVDSTRMLERVTGAPPRGFRAPGYDLDGEGLALLEAHGYDYDCSVFPTSVGPLLRMSQWAVAGQVRTAYPWLSQLTAPTRPYRPAPNQLYRGGGEGIMEIPVTVLPWLRWPLHFSYAALLGRWYLRRGLAWALDSADPVNFLFHLVDFADPIHDPRLRRVPGIRMPLETRLALADEAVRTLASRATVLRTSELYEQLVASHGHACAAAA